MLLASASRPCLPQCCRPKCVPKCSLSKYGFRASGVRTSASAHRAKTGLLPRFLSSVLKCPSQEVRRELASGERFSGFSGSCQSTGLHRKPQETCHTVRWLVRRRVWLAYELAEEALPDTNGLQAVALESGADDNADFNRFPPAHPLGAGQ